MSEENIVDHNVFEKNKNLISTNEIIGLVGTGIFFYAALQTISYLSFTVLTDILLFSQLKPLFIYGLAEFLRLTLFLILFVIGVRKIKTMSIDRSNWVKRIFIASFLLYVLAEALGFLQPLVSLSFKSMEYFNLKDMYHSNLNGQQSLMTLAIETPAIILKYLFMALFILKEIKQKNTNSFPS